MARTASLFFVLLILFASRAGANAVEPSTPPSDDADTQVLALQEDRIGRPVLEAYVNGEGPFRFIVDTAATRTSLSEEFATALGLEYGEPAFIDDLTGQREVDTVIIDHMQVGDLVLEDVRALIISQRALHGADALVGLDVLARHWVSFTFPDAVELRAEGRRLRGRSANKLDADIDEAGLVVVRGRIGNVRSSILIDTGGGISIANTALREALSDRQWRRWLAGETRLIGASGDWMAGDVAIVSRMTIDELLIRNAPIVVGDFHIFRAIGLADEPAMILGMDILQYTSRLVIDFDRSEVFIQP